MAEATLDFIAEQMRRLIADVSAMRDEQRVQGAMLIRVDRTLSALVDELRETHVQVTA
ncbi:MAG: hypothetical protein FWD12_09920 [Alphaproteobacteria bacterium]|nr:hypothetical protein [Alphaproteobacteria bacterium]